MLFRSVHAAVSSGQMAEDACSAEPERSGGWLLEHVWHFCDDLQETRESLSGSFKHVENCGLQIWGVT